MLVARRADELRCGAVVRAGPHPLDSKAGSGNDPGGDLRQLAQCIHRQSLGGQHPVGLGVVDHRAVGAHCYRRKSEPVDHWRDPPWRAAGSEHEKHAGVDCGAHGVAGTRGDLLLFVDQGAVDIAGDQRGQSHSDDLPGVTVGAPLLVASAPAILRCAASANRPGLARCRPIAVAPSIPPRDAGTTPAPGRATRSSPGAARC